MAFSLTPLPYGYNALAPYISPKTLEIHHTKHHKAYVDNLNGLVKDTPYETMPLLEIIKKEEDNKHDRRIFNNGAQIWNHAFYWESLSNQSEDKENIKDSPLNGLIERDFGTRDALISSMITSGLAQFGSGWVWLVLDKEDKLAIRKTSNAEIVWGQAQDKPLLICDVWEHAYYLDYQSARKDYLEKILSHLLNWRFAARQLGADHLFCPYT